MQDLSGKIDGNQLSAAEFIETETELLKLITGGGLVPSGGDLNQVAKALSTQIPSNDFLTATGTQAVTVLTSVGAHQPIDSLVDGMRLRFRPVGDNIGTVTIDVDTIGAESILRPDGSALRAQDLLGAEDAMVRWDASSGGRFLLLNRQNEAFSKGHLFGGHTVLSSTNEITVAACEFRNDLNTADGIAPSFAKNFGSAFALGNGVGVGGFPPGASRATSSPFGVFELVNQDGDTELGFDDSATGANLVARAEVLSATGWSARRILILMSDGSVNTDLERFVHTEQDLSYIRYKTPVNFLNESVLQTAQTTTLPAPPQCPANVVVSLSTTSGADIFGYLTSTEETDYEPDISQHDFAAGLETSSSQITVVSDDSRTVRYETSKNSGNIAANVIGYYFNRGSE